MPGTLELTNTHPALRYCWHPVARSADVGERPHRVFLLGEPWLLVRLGVDGELVAFFDRCPHRMAPLSIGSIVEPAGGGGSVLQCAYHGWCFDAEGRCTEI
ncbi:MAG TPA: Rieske 2Fe-2S domain-containing protein, partial [Acidimicrobiales bacterium]|nr:Rieske 2Fe-2S domain-containing protein [Acidimicrobiales bacterium]